MSFGCGSTDPARTAFSLHLGASCTKVQSYCSNQPCPRDLSHPQFVCMVSARLLLGALLALGLSTSAEDPGLLAEAGAAGGRRCGCAALTRALHGAGRASESRSRAPQGVVACGVCRPGQPFWIFVSLAICLEPLNWSMAPLLRSLSLEALCHWPSRKQ